MRRRLLTRRALYAATALVTVAAIVEAVVWLRGPSPERTPPAPSAAPRRAPSTYAFVRDTTRWGPSSVPYDLARRYGAHTVLLASNDANLAAAVAAAKARDEPYGIWVPEGDGPPDPAEYARYVASLVERYAPQTVVLNVEARGRGGPGSAGWTWNRRAADAFARAAPRVELGVAVLPNEVDFNYGAWLRAGATAFLPEAFGADPRTERYDPKEVVETVVRSGVPRSLVEPLLAPGQRYDRPASYYPLDDLPVGGPPAAAPRG